MSLDDDIRLLSGLELFSDFNAEQLRLIAFGSEKINFPAGTQIFHDGQPADGGYVICEGEVELWIEKCGNKNTLAKLGRGDLVGEIAILTSTRRIGTAMTISNCSVIRVSRSTMLRVLEEYPELAAKLHDHIASNVISFTAKLETVHKRLRQED